MTGTEPGSWTCPACGVTLRITHPSVVVTVGKDGLLTVLHRHTPPPAPKRRLRITRRGRALAWFLWAAATITVVYAAAGAWPALATALHTP